MVSATIKSWDLAANSDVRFTSISTLACPLLGAKRTVTNRCVPISIYELAFINKKGRRPKPTPTQEMPTAGWVERRGSSSLCAFSGAVDATNAAPRWPPCRSRGMRQDGRKACSMGDDAGELDGGAHAGPVR